jgi:hypothetical protein
MAEGRHFPEGRLQGHKAAFPDCQGTSALPLEDGVIGRPSLGCGVVYFFSLKLLIKLQTNQFR